MKLSSFISTLIQQGSVRVEEEISPFEPEDLESTANFLRSFHAYDQLEMPLEAPKFDEVAAIWAAKYIYRALQFVVVRKHTESVIRQELQPLNAAITPESVYSADLCLRYLPQIFNFAKSLSPEDPLLQNLLKTAQDWPFSSLGIEIEHEIQIPNHPSLAIAYRDKIVAQRDLKRAKNPNNQKAIEIALGSDAQQLWPSFEILATKENENI